MTQPLNRRHFSAGLALAPFAAGGLLTGCSNVPDTLKIGVAQPLSERDYEIANALGPILASRGLLLVGLDVIGDSLKVSSKPRIRAELRHARNGVVIGRGHPLLLVGLFVGCRLAVIAPVGSWRRPWAKASSCASR